ncbi:hypothetical protein BH10PSE13_BH10PSE13_17770 [soil metagenome]
MLLFLMWPIALAGAFYGSLHYFPWWQARMAKEDGPDGNLFWAISDFARFAVAVVITMKLPNM